MSPTLQTILALGVVAATAAAFIWRAIARRNKPSGCAGCGSGAPAAFSLRTAKRRRWPN